MQTHPHQYASFYHQLFCTPSSWLALLEKTCGFNEFTQIPCLQCTTTFLNPHHFVHQLACTPTHPVVLRLPMQLHSVPHVPQEPFHPISLPDAHVLLQSLVAALKTFSFDKQLRMRKMLGDGGREASPNAGEGREGGREASTSSFVFCLHALPL